VFAPAAATLADAVAELGELGAAGGGAIDPLTRRRALASYLAFGPERRSVPQRWRHRYAALPFEDLFWSTGRVRLPTAERAAGLVHAGSAYVQPPAIAGDPRIALLSLADAMRAVPERVAAVHGQVVAPDADRFTALSTAFQNCGAFLDVPDGVALDEPIPLVWTSRPGPHGAIFPHTVVRLGAGARASVVERHLGEDEAFVAGIVEIDLAPGAHLDYAIVQQADGGTRIIMRRAARCAEGAAMKWHVADLGGALCRSVFETRLAGNAASGDVNALFFPTGFANVDLTIDLDHMAPATASQTIVRSVAKDLALGRFAGDVRIGAHAQGARASMRADALVLSRDAYIEAIPALDIDTNDVSAFHAATIGSLDEEQLFYAQSRGINRANAERMVALAFFEPAISGFPSDALREEVRAALDSRLEEVPETFAS
jgi:Fe-S cluster assembly protein SufD